MKKLFYFTSKLIRSALLLLLIGGGGAAFGATFIVTKPEDSNDGVCNVDCSLREAVAAANASPANDTIDFNSQFNQSQSIQLQGSEIVIQNNGTLFINGRPGLLTITTFLGFRIFSNAGATVTINGIIFTNGTGTGAVDSGLGGAVLNSSPGMMTIGNSRFWDNSANRGGGIYNAGTLIVNNTLFHENTTVSDGGSIYNAGTLTLNTVTVKDNSSNEQGGGIFNSGGTAGLINSTVNNNSAVSGGGIANSGTLNLTTSTIDNNTSSSGNGGGIFNSGGAVSVNVVTSTVSGNSTAGSGGGIYAPDGTAITISDSTFTANVSDSDANGLGIGGGIYNFSGGTVTARNTIIAGNFDRSGASPDFSGTLNSEGYNLIGNVLGIVINGTTTGNILGQNAQLLPLGNYGGPTKTHALQPNSPAIDASNPANFSAADQRGVARPLDGDASGSSLPDIGAYERQMISFTVTKTADTNDGACDADCSLREAVAAANSGATPTRENIINFSPLVFGTAQTITLSLGQIQLNAGIFSINGTGANLLTLSGNNTNRIFEVTPSGNAILNDLTIANGRAQEFNAGGGIYSGGTLSLNNVTVTGNVGGFGAGINSYGSLRVSNSVFTSNIAESEGAGIKVNNGSAEIVNSTFSANRAAVGGGIYNSSVLSITDSTFTGNIDGGGLYNWGEYAKATVFNSVFSANVDGGIQSLGAANMTILNSSIINNPGSGIQNIGTMSIVNTLISGNRGGIGCGNGSTTLNNVNVVGNTTNGSGSGGGINADNGTLTVTNSTISNNTASGAGSGGGIFSNIPTIYLTNTTISDNTAGGSGGGIHAGGTWHVSNVTVSGNTAINNSGGLHVRSNGIFNVRNSIFSDNSTPAGAIDVAGPINSQGYNLIENARGAVINGSTTGNILGRDARLAQLRGAGGPTNTVALQATSPAIDAGDPANSPSADQRGVARPQDGNRDGLALPDMGAYERVVTVFRVTKIADTNDGVCDSDCSLREAIAAANTAQILDSEIIFDAAVFGPPRTIVLASGELVSSDANGTLAIFGKGANLLTIYAGNQSRAFFNTGTANLTLIGMQIIAGNGAGAVNNGVGGAVLNNNGRSTFVFSTVGGNSANTGGGVGNMAGLIKTFNSTVANNTAATGAGGLFNEAGSTLELIDSVVNANSSTGAGGVENAGKLLILRSTVNANTGGGLGGGGVKNSGGGAAAEIFNSIINNNVLNGAGSGGGVYNSGTVKIDVSTLAANSATSGTGGGVYNSGVLNILSSTVSENSASSGGGISLQGVNTALVNSTISGNSATGNGGGLFNQGNNIIITNVTIAANSAGAGGGVRNTGQAIVSRNSLIADNTAGTGPDFYGDFSSQSYNLIENPAGLNFIGLNMNNILGVDPQLMPLANYGGLTKTHALPLTSAAVDKGAFSGSVEAKDQRGFLRPVNFPSIPNANSGDASDIGAFERQNPEITRRGIFDFDGDGKTDLSIFRPSAGEWWYLRSSDGGNYAAQFGASTDKLTPGDFTGDGKTDIAFWRPASGEWFVLRSEDSSYYSYPFGTTGDIPVVGDFDADGKADSTIFRPSTATWYIRRSSDGGATIQQFGATGDVPVAADYDGDGKSDIAIFRPSAGEWWLSRSTAGGIAFQFGNSADKPTAGDFTGDGKADVAFWRPSTGEWFVLRSEDQSYYSFPFGTNGDVPAPGDYDGDGKFDAGIFRPSGSTWYVQRSTAGTLIQGFGQSGDTPVPNAFIP